MSLQRFFIVFAGICFLAAAAAMAFLPARIDSHDDDMRIKNRPTAVRALSLTGYYMALDPKNLPNATIGTTPYSFYHVRTFAFELWFIGGIFCLVALKMHNKKKIGK